MADKILSRLGIYDILGVLFSGICMGASTLVLLKISGVNVEIIKDETLAFFIFSYMAGFVFQEFTSFLQRKWFNRGNKLLLKAIRYKEHHNLYMEKAEVEEVKQQVLNKIKKQSKQTIIDDQSANIVYNYCKNYISKNEATARVDRDQALAAMARSLSLYCFLAPLIFLLPLTFEITPILSVSWRFVISCFLLALSALFYFRFKRFTYRRFIAIYRYYLYNEIWNKKDSQICQEDTH